MKSYYPKWWPLALLLFVPILGTAVVFTAHTGRAAEPQPVANVTVNRIPSTTVPFPGGNYPIEVTRVIDGDTIDVRFKVWTDITLEKRLRFTDIDTWETRGANKEKGLEAKEVLIGLLRTGDPYMNTLGKTGSFGRTLATVYVVTPQGEVSVAEELKELGYEKKKE